MKENLQDRLLWIVNAMFDPPDDMDEGELSSLEDEFSDSIEHPAGAALLHYPETWGLGESPTANQIVSEALGWRPRVLAMKIVSVRPHFKRPDLFIYDVLSGRIRTQVVSSVPLQQGQVCDVALSGAKLPDGRLASHGFVDNVYTVGEVIGPSKSKEGTEIPIESS